MKNKKLLLIVSLALAMMMSLGGTLAYLTDTDSDVNVMTVGRVDIEQHEYERVVDENGNPVKGVEGTDFKADYNITESYKLQPFTQMKPALPAVYGEEGMDWDEFQQLWNQVGAPGSNDLFTPNMKNVIDKFVFVENTGNTDAYYRTIIAIEWPETELGEELVHVSFNGNSRFDYNDDVAESQNAEKSNSFYTTIDGCRYKVYVATYTEKLAPKEVSRPSLLQLYLDPKADNEEVALFGDTWDVLVVTQAVQATGFGDADTALDEAFKDVNENSHPWLDWNDPKDENDQEPDWYDAVVSNTAELSAALKNVKAGESIIIKLNDGTYESPENGHGKNITLMGSKKAIVQVKIDKDNYDASDYGYEGSTLKLHGVTLKVGGNGAGNYQGFARAVLELNNCTVQGTLWTCENATFNNCTFEIEGDSYNVWTWGAKNIKFDGCTFNTSGKSILLYNNVDTTLEVSNCVFNDRNDYDNVNNKAAIEVGSDWTTDKKTIIANNVKVNGFDITNKGINTGSTLWGNKNSLSPDRLSVTIDGEKVY